ncbi:MBL fold metallo-hydrolase [Shimia sp.]|uniref:MBL fold metallo-hydrolase n=1 Tax=Shimia sp. TaxID=1954381 RepID=UPI003BA8B5E7
MTERTHSLNIGDFEVTTFNDGGFVLPSAYFSQVPEDVDLGDEVEIGANFWVVRGQNRVILVDTGSAQALQARFPQTGQAWEPLQGETPTDIVLTHMHADHLGGFLDSDVFPEVTIHIAEAEWAFWTNPDLPNAVDEDTRPMVQMIQSVAAGIKDRVVLFQPKQSLISGISLVPLPGHTPGHSGVQIESGNETLLIIGDAVISEAVQFAHPEVTYALDGDAAQAVVTRRALLAEAAASGTTIAATHFAFPGLGKVAAEGETFRFLPL